MLSTRWRLGDYNQSAFYPKHRSSRISSILFVTRNLDFCFVKKTQLFQLPYLNQHHAIVKPEDVCRSLSLFLSFTGYIVIH